MYEMRLYVLQRTSAALMLPLMFGHLFVMFYSIDADLSAANIVARTQGSVGWAVFYGLFVVLAALHGAIGVRSVLREWTRLSHRSLDTVMVIFGALLLVLGARAVIAVIVPGGFSA